MEGPVHLAVILAGRYFVKGAAQAPCQDGTLLGVDTPQVQQVCLVGQQDYRGHVGTAATYDQLVQLIDQIEAAAVGHGVHQHHSIGPLHGAAHVVGQTDAIICHLGTNRGGKKKNVINTRLPLRSISSILVLIHKINQNPGKIK